MKKIHEENCDEGKKVEKRGVREGGGSVLLRRRMWKRVRWRKIGANI